MNCPLRTPAAAPAPGLAPLPPLYGAVPVPGDLIVLEHSSYRQIFQCPLSLVSDLFNVLLDVVCQYFFEDLSIYVHQ